VCACLHCPDRQYDSLSNAKSAYAAGDYAKVAKLFRPLAEQGDAGAQVILGSLYNLSQGVPQDCKEAVKWYRLAAEQGNANAQSRLGGMYYIGQDVPQNYVLTHMWINIAAANTTDSKDQKNLTELRDLTANGMTTQQIVETQELARKCTANKFKGY